LRYTEAITGLAFLTDGRLAATSGSLLEVETQAGSLKLWDPVSGRELRNYADPTEAFTCLEASPDGKTLATGGSSKNVRTWDAETGRVLQAFQGHTAAITCLAWGHDGKTLL